MTTTADDDEGAQKELLTHVLWSRLSRVAKCQFFYTEQNPWTKFHPKKTRKLQHFWDLSETKLTQIIVLDNKCWQLFQIKLVYTQKSF